MSKEILNLKPAGVWKHFYSLTQIPRPTGHIDVVADFVANFGKELGLETRQDEVKNVLIVKPASPGMEKAPTVVLQAHLDMVPQANNEVKHNFFTDPIDAWIDGDKVRARSTTLGADNGVGAAAIMAVLEDNSLSHGTIEALFTIDEEVGMVGANGLKPGFLTGSIMLNLDTEEEGELCVGCAGGVDVNISWQFKELAAPKEHEALKISLTGLRGGHSGCDIHLGRANANKLLFRFLKEAVREHEARLSWVDGGSLRNAIPREATAIVTAPHHQCDEIVKLVDYYKLLFIQEYKSIEIEELVSFTAEKTELPATVFPEEIQDNLINAIEGCQNGPISMLTDFPGTVESSTSLASVKSFPELVEVKFLTRASSESRKMSICSSLQSVFQLAGAKVDFDASYPGWNPNINSPLLKIMQEVYEEKYGKKPVTQVIHAGLECGIILGAAPDMDVVSFGPTIVNPHSPSEYVEIESVGKFYDYLLEVLAKLK